MLEETEQNTFAPLDSLLSTCVYVHKRACVYAVCIKREIIGGVYSGACQCETTLLQPQAR